eukprot:5446054-Prymnesium_polylepis.1
MAGLAQPGAQGRLPRCARGRLRLRLRARGRSGPAVVLRHRRRRHARSHHQRPRPQRAGLGGPPGVLPRKGPAGRSVRLALRRPLRSLQRSVPRPAHLGFAGGRCPRYVHAQRL